MTLCTWVAQAGYATGKHVQAFPFFGAERRGAPVKAFVRVDEEPIYLRSQVYHPDLLVVMSPDLTGLALKEGITPEGMLLVNAEETLAERFTQRFSRDIHYIDATGIAMELGLEFDGMPMVNLPLFGAIVRQSGAAPLEAVLDLTRKVAAKRSNAGAYETAVKRGWKGTEVVIAGAKGAAEQAAVDNGDLDLSRSGVTPIEP